MLGKSEVQEDEGILRVCANVESPDLDCPIVFPFELIFTTTAGTACKSLDLYLTLSAHAQEGYGTCLVCVSVSVCLCVCMLAL